MEHRWGQRTKVCLPAEVRGLSGASGAVGVILDMSVSGALLRTALDANAFTSVEVKVNREWLLAWVTRRATPGVLGIEWMALAPDAVVRQLEVAAFKLPQPDEMAVA